MRSLLPHRVVRLAAFTLTELLVTLIVLGILVMLLGSGLLSARRSAQQTQCVANLRTMGQASLLMFQENNGNLFPHVFWYVPVIHGKANRFLELLEMQQPLAVDQPGSFRDTFLTCPAFKTAKPALFPSHLNRSYSLNYFAHAFGPNEQQSNLPVIPRLSPGNLRFVRQPSKMWLFTDGSAGAGFVFTYINQGHFNYLAAPHRGRQNVVFFDGHIESVEKERFLLPLSDDFWGGPKTIGGS